VIDASEIDVRPGLRGRARETDHLAGGFGHHREPVRLLHDSHGRPSEFWMSGTKLLPQDKLAREMAARYR
jgi:D-alanyl-D-alanine carboxypeptidase